MKLFYEHTCSKTGNKFKKRTDHFFWKIILPFVGFFSLLWFLIRVIPKPSRMIYPCQKIAGPLGLNFLLQLIAFFGLLKIGSYGSKIKKKQTAICLLTTFFIVLSLLYSNLHFTSLNSMFLGTADVERIVFKDVVYGKGKGIFPGRVTWSHNSRATTWDGLEGFWWENKNTDQKFIDEMVSKSILSLTGEKNDYAAWQAIFNFHNKGRGYKQGEKIAIKLNMNGVTDHNQNENVCFSSPHLVYSLLNQLVSIAGVSPSDIIVFDASRSIHKSIYDKCNVEKFKGVVFADSNGGNGRIKSVIDNSNEVFWSYNMGGSRTFLPKYVTESTYMINLSSVKGHDLTGVTLTAKNHFGTIMTKDASSHAPQPPHEANLHGYVAAHSVNWGVGWTFSQRNMETYNPIVDLIGHKDLGGKTVLYILDGLYVGRSQNALINTSSKWLSEPFSGHWPSSIFMSMDPVAIDSVGTDFILNEPVINTLNTVIHPNTTLLNYLHEASLANNPPSKTIYKPNGDGKVLDSLGVYEHWNNSIDKQYSRNLGKSEGIELIKTSLSYSPSPSSTVTPTNSSASSVGGDAIPTPDLISHATPNDDISIPTSELISRTNANDDMSITSKEGISTVKSDTKSDESINENTKKTQEQIDRTNNVLKYYIIAIVAIIIVFIGVGLKFRRRI